MNRVVFFFFFFLLVVFPLSINNIENESINYVKQLKKITNNLAYPIAVAEVKTSNELVLSKNELRLINLKNKELKNIEQESDIVFFENHNILSIKINKDINKILAYKEWEKFVEHDGGLRGIYINGYDLFNVKKMENITNIVNETNVNTLVIDVKTDHGHLLYDSETFESEQLNNERVKFDKEYLSSLKSELNIYLIGRVVAFQDPIFAKTYNSSAVLEGTTGEIFSMNGQYFLDPSDTKSRNYILNVALEACSLGFDEIQFDYIRYPDSTDTKLVFDEVSNFESRTKNINSFLSEATLLLNENGCLVSADIFGYVLQSKSDNGIGQHLESIVSAVNFISPMVYPSHYSKGSFGYANPNEYPYEVVTEALEGGLIRINNNNKIRPYLQGFWHTVDGVKQNIKAAEDKSLHWIIWNNSSMYDIEYFIKLKS